MYFPVGAMNASLQSQHHDEVTPNTRDLGLRMDTSGATDFPVSNEPDRDPQHVSGIDLFGTGRLFAQSHRFLENMKGYFGVHSRQSVAIHDTLGGFRVGRLPKQDVNRIIIGHLGDRIDLIKDYMSIANPQDVFIGSPGFQHHHQESAPSTPVSLVSPGFLQPQHQPRLTMPLWSPIQFTERTHHVNHAPISPELLRGPRTSASMAPRDMLPFQQLYQQAINYGYRNHNACQPVYAQSMHNDTHGFKAQNFSLSPTTLAPVPFGGQNQYTSPAMGHIQQPSFSPCTSFNYGSQLSSPLRGINAQSQRSYSLHEGWQRNQLGNSWVNQRELEFSAGRIFDSPPLAKERPSPPFHLGDPVVVPLGQPAFDMLPPKKCNRKLSQASTKPEEERKHIENARSRKPSAVTITPIQPSQSSQQSSALRPSTRAPRAKGHFVHSICGTAFTSRYAVKKHHWGNKCDDLETTTGCWAKNKKPNVQWDEHPSCKEQQALKACIIRPYQQDTSETISLEFRASVVPVITPSSQNTVLGARLPSFNDLPQTVTKSARGSLSSPPFQQAGTLPYDTSRLPVRGGLDSLLTAVNLAVKIDAPTPQGRNDSVVSKLDAQVAAAEERRLKTTSKSAAPRNQSDSTFSYETHPIPPETETLVPTLSEVGLGITEAQQNHLVASGEESTGEQQIQNFGIPNAEIKIIADVDYTQPYLVDQPLAGVHITPSEKRSRKRVRGPHDSISNRELKMLFESSPPRRKRQRPANLGDYART